MRFHLASVLTLSLLAGCSPPSANLFGENQQSDTGRNAAAPTVTIATTGPGGCAASWDGSPVSPAEITERSVALLQRTIEAAGGPQGMTEDSFPIPDVEAPADLGMTCADTILFALQRSGMTGVRLRPGPGQASVLADFPIDMNAPPPPIPMVLGLGAGGRITWNDAPLDAAGLEQRLGQQGGTELPAASETPAPVVQAPPGGIELRVTREATFGQLYQLLRATQRYQLRPVLYLPSAQIEPTGAAPPSPVIPPPPITPGGPPPVVPPPAVRR